MTAPSSADMTKQLLKKREQEIDKRVADLKSKLGNNDHGTPTTQASSSSRTINNVQRSVSQSSDESIYQVNNNQRQRKGLQYASAFSADERSTNPGSDHDGGGLYHKNHRTNSSSSAYPTNRRINSMKKPSFVPSAKSKKNKKTWGQLFCPCYPGRKNAAEEAQSANARFERQRLLAEEGRLGYDTRHGGHDYGSAGTTVDTPSNSYHAHYVYGNQRSPSYGAATPRRSRTNRQDSQSRLTPIYDNGKRSSPPSVSSRFNN